MKTYTVYTDGSCKPNPGTGGYAVLILRDSSVLQEFYEGEQDTTNNRMELKAVIKAMELLPEEAHAAIISDSKYVVNSINRGYKRNVNKDLWLEYDRLVGDKKQHITMLWVKGHSNNRYNERVDQLAQLAAAKERDNG